MTGKGPRRHILWRLSAIHNLGHCGWCCPTLRAKQWHAMAAVTGPLNGGTSPPAGRRALVPPFWGDSRPTAQLPQNAKGKTLRKTERAFLLAYHCGARNLCLSFQARGQGELTPALGHILTFTSQGGATDEHTSQSRRQKQDSNTSSTSALRPFPPLSSCCLLLRRFPAFRQSQRAFRAPPRARKRSTRRYHEYRGRLSLPVFPQSIQDNTRERV